MNKKAFTLLELLVVVLIIGILAGIALPQYKKAVLKSRFAAIKDKTRVIFEAEQRYYLVNNAYTKNWADLDITIPDASSICNLNYYNTYVICNLQDKNGNNILQYIIMTETGQARCDAFPGDPNSLANQICKMETGKEPNSNPCNPTFCVYYY